MTALELIKIFLSNRNQKAKVNEEYSSWEEILLGNL